MQNKYHSITVPLTITWCMKNVPKLWLRTDLFLTEVRLDRVKFLCGRRGAGEGAGAGAGAGAVAGGEVRARRPPAAAALAASSTTIHHLGIARSRGARDAQDTLENVL
ncbi:unnamed protein product, partial [Iphiclides podalirius]